jgi:uncharacterized protein (DUF433 family)
MQTITLPLKAPIISNPDILGGTPVISGTRIPASLILELYNSGYNQDLILKEYPSLTKRKLQKFFKLLATCLNDSQTTMQTAVR